jgi:BirA family biotin operon repressor/biotin-[acetyl-CoA-carboxylase] ligase
VGVRREQPSIFDREKIMPRESTQLRILHLLKENFGKPVSGKTLASLFGLSRTGIWKHIQNLKTLGYRILSHPKEGYKLLDVPDALIAEEIIPDLHTSWVGSHYHHFQQIGSTNDYAMELAARGAPHGTVVIAEEQTRGKGRLARTWVSQPHLGIYVSIVLTNPLPLLEAHHATMIAALSLSEILETTFGVPARIKWPNDILVNGRKITGILTEMQSDQDYTRFLVIGVGINVNHETHDMEGPFRYPATSLAIESGHPVRRKDLLIAFLRRFEDHYDTFLKEGFSTFLPQIEKLSAVLNKEIRIVSGKNQIAGRAVGFTPEGGLRICNEKGKEEVVWAGDITQLEGSD